ncbi:hypothetical protein SAMN04489761_0703 [Tenacibaculum sp. MAR_2009_124]|uniref:hypothetical protein n=1 Tax=Tenacibaculum sp. MAR_2009_124 TaxID=1250059 RepID=UPI0008949FF3|nr:hypothetical protein [Tenacibaculum sp. MAR_2009_124]SEB43626.1 hypothetical protein SAMN04489761_0703 [Tenacibaculum sp. MAR_2009_124]
MRIRKITCFLFIVILVGCKINETPTFLKLDDLNVVSVDANQIILAGNALFDNPNHIGGKMTIEGLNVILNKAKLANVESEEFDIPMLDEFAIPFNISIPVLDLYVNDKNNLVKGIIDSLLKKTVKLHFKGVITYRLLDFTSNYTVDEEKEIEIKI